MKTTIRTLMLISILFCATAASYGQDRVSGIYATSADYNHNNLTFKGHSYSYVFGSRRAKVGKTRVVIGDSTSYWGGQVADEYCRFADRQILHILMEGTYCIYTNFHGWNQEVRFRYENDKVIDFSSTDESMLWVSKGLDAPVYKVNTPEEMKFFLKENAELARPYDHAFGKYTDHEKENRWIVLINTILAYQRKLKGGQ